MRKLITNDETNCVGCNRCIRACPVDGANDVLMVDEKIKISVNNERCIACGSCIATCRHEVRGYEDDTESFIDDLKNGASISMIVAPANRINGEDGGRVLTWLRNIGVRKIYDVSLGADICTWGHIRLIQRDNPKSVITQPCPAIVDFIQLYQPDLLKYLSPVHSPMLCAAIYMKKYENISDSIAALSPCIAKAHEFEATSYVKYNVTTKKLFEYIERNNIQLPANPSGFDHADSAFGRLYPMPGGLKENIEFYFGKKMRVDQAEGQQIVYDALREFSHESEECLPAVFDVLNCHEGCNIGTGVEHNRSRFRTGMIMEENRKRVLTHYDSKKYERLLREYDRKLKLDDFIRKYPAKAIKQQPVTEEQIQQAFIALNKKTPDQQIFDCGACGCDSCYDMARRVVLGLSVPSNCIQKLRDEVVEEKAVILKIAESNTKSIDHLTHDIADIKDKSNSINDLIVVLNDMITKYNNISTDINSIASYINIISLNAAVEAARAGEAGKTFAVVADEIRNLANKSKSTVSESEVLSKKSVESISAITNMISDIIGNIDRAYISISIIDQSLNNSLEHFGDRITRAGK